MAYLVADTTNGYMTHTQYLCILVASVGQYYDIFSLLKYCYVTRHEKTSLIYTNYMHISYFIGTM